MAFCNKCGTEIKQGTRFCSKCGAPILASAFPSASTPASASAPNQAPSAPPAASPQSSNALKIVLIIVGVILVIGVLGVGALTFVGLRIAKHTHVKQEGEHVKVETPFGTVESTKDPEQAAKDLGIEIYPGAEVRQNGAASATLGNLHSVNAEFESDDSVEKVCSFYKSKFPNATVNTSDEHHCTIVSAVPPNVITINVEPNGDASRFQVSSVAKK
jgi:flagellar basal body-associated protein FliL